MNKAFKDNVYISRLAEETSLSELNSMLLELFRLKTQKITPAELMQKFDENRFVLPANVDPLVMKEMELDWLKMAQHENFKPIILSPLAPLGTCSAVGHVDQNNIVSATRGTEVVSDATNVLALKIASDIRSGKASEEIIKYATVHRHVRGQHFENPNFTAHFNMLCLASGGLDTGSYAFELSQLNAHLSLLYHILTKSFSEEDLTIRFYLKKGSDMFKEKLLECERYFWSNRHVELIEDQEHEYYKLIQFKIFLNNGKHQLDLADGGLVDWTKSLLSNNKHRMFISGVGMELVYKLVNKL